MSVKITKSKLTWIVGLLAAILTAATAYMTSSCSAGRSTMFQADSLYIHNLNYQHQSHIDGSK
ncbi:hypothetical protein [Peromfec virus RodF8_8]|uniref:Uncharacterized protein n=1 Tax=Peromfec virus RodF8_8 TaxID=2929389 RepID=A0A976N372_9VIRU|nr:hypothetical protein [Peromfec virus RodF8_8]